MIFVLLIIYYVNGMSSVSTGTSLFLFFVIITLPSITNCSDLHGFFHKIYTPIVTRFDKDTAVVSVILITVIFVNFFVRTFLLLLNCPFQNMTLNAPHK